MPRNIDADLEHLLPGDPQSQAIARGFLSQFGDTPENWALVKAGVQHHFAIGAAETPEEAAEARAEADAFLAPASLLEQGYKPHVVADLSKWIDKTTAEVAAEPEAKAEADKPAAEEPADPPPQPAPAPAKAQPAPAPGMHRPFAGKPAPVDNSARITELETKYMRAPEGTPEWTAYWRGPLAQELRGLYEAREAAEAPQAPAPAAPTPGAGPGVAA